jgi:2-haloacid dehalogenase
MPAFEPAGIRVVACDIFGTTVDWRSGVADQVAEVTSDLSVTSFLDLADILNC